MRVLDYSFDDPALNIALEEVLLDEVEAGAEDVLRFWESPVRFVVLGTSQHIDEEVYVDRCAAEGVPILRRCTAGGCVLQGPGSLNFTLALRYEHHPGTQTLHASYCYILQRLAGVLAIGGIPLQVRGACDLAWNDLKISGNAQRRKRNAFLHHGTLLHKADIEGMQRYLREPKDRPDYRGDRAHDTFVGALPLGPEMIREQLTKAFTTLPPVNAPHPHELVAAQRLAGEKYRTREWTHRR